MRTTSIIREHPIRTPLPSRNGVLPACRHRPVPWIPADPVMNTVPVHGLTPTLMIRFCLPVHRLHPASGYIANLPPVPVEITAGTGSFLVSIAHSRHNHSGTCDGSGHFSHGDLPQKSASSCNRAWCIQALRSHCLESSRFPNRRIAAFSTRELVCPAGICR